MFSHYLYLFYVWQQKICKWEQLYWAFSYIKVCNSLESRKVLKCQKLSECKPDAVRVLLVVLVYLIVSTWSSCALLLYIVPLSLMSLLVHCVSSLCVREFLVSQLVILVVLYFTLLVSLALHLVLLKFIRFPLLLLFCSSLVPVFSFFKPLVWFLSLFRFFCLSQFLFQLSIPSICLLVHFLVLFALCSLNLFFFVLFFLVIVCSECLILLLMVLLWSCLVCCALSCLFLFCVLIPPGCCSQDLAIWLDWVHYSSKYQALVAQAAAWFPAFSLTGAALSPLFSSQTLSRSDFSHPPVLQQTALSYCLDSHIPC